MKKTAGKKTGKGKKASQALQKSPAKKIIKKTKPTHIHSHCCPKCGYRSNTHIKCPSCRTRLEEICKECGHAKSICAYSNCKACSKACKC